ncbi:MAG TPA: hypothetical protein VKZ18_18350, partial [Polyangia bacterium]|nr:hypothetical protein [Polyangia bacterium]
MKTRRTKMTILSVLLAGGVSAGAWIGGCSTDPAGSGMSAHPDTGSIDIGLVVGGGAVLNSATYTITGPAGFSSTGT